ncbi:MAG: site-2 protease family protein [Phycisphaerae bacterium]|jgi:regulator of sigma E protease
MSEQGNVKSKNMTNLLFLAALIGIVIYFISKNVEKSASIILSFVGLGVVIFVHEFGHFIAGKLSDICVEAFAIGFGPVVIGVKRCEKFLRFRILPTILLKDNDPDGEGLLCLKLPMNCKAGETEYQLRIFPLGGFVKLLGQEDVGADKPSDNPRSFLNRPIWKRIMVGSAGVIFNVILAIAFFVVVFTRGINMPPAIVGGTIPGYPAEKAGLMPGDEIISVDGKNNIDFTTVAMAAALSGKGEPVNMTVKRADGKIEDVNIIAKELPGAGFRGFGILPSFTLEMAKIETPEAFLAATGLKAGDILTTVDGEKIEQPWQYTEKIQQVFEPTVELSFQRPGQNKPVVFTDRLEFNACIEYQDGGEFIPSHIGGIIPRLKIISVESANGNQNLKRISKIISVESADVNQILQKGDIIVRVADIANPTYQELRQATITYAEQDLKLTVLRNSELIEATVVPKIGKDGRAVIGIGVGLDIDNPIVAAVADANTSQIGSLPRGAEIVSFAGEGVKNFFDIAAALEKNRGKTVKIIYRSTLDEKQMDYAVGQYGDILAVSPITAYELPFKPLRKLYRADGAVDAMKMGTRKTVEFIAQTYMTIKGLIVGDISPKSLMGPVGMISASSKIIESKEYIHYLNFMGIISACLAVMNFLPLPILDGGLVLMLIIEKIKGSPVHTKIQEWLVYIGLALIGGLFVLITYNDILRVFFDK